MGKYLKVADVFKGELFIDSDCDDVIVDDLSLTVLESFSGSDAAKFALHAINSHDELVAMNKELLAALEAVIEWYDMEADHSIEPDFYKRMASCQVSEDMAREAIAKAKAAS